MEPFRYHVGGADSGIFIREFQPEDLPQCKYLLEHTQSLYGNPAVYVKMTFETDMKDIVRNYLELTDQDKVLPTSSLATVQGGAGTYGGARRGTWLVAVDTNNQVDGRDIVCGQVAIHPLLIGDPNVHEYYSSKMLELINSPASERPFPYSLDIPADDVCELRRMAVLPSYQANKVGYCLLSAFEMFAKNTLKYKIVHLTTLVSMDKAVAFYTRQKFTCERLEFLRMGIRDAPEGESLGGRKEIPGVVERREIFGGLGELTADEMRDALQSPAESSTLYVIHFWKEL